MILAGVVGGAVLTYPHKKIESGSMYIISTDYAHIGFEVEAGLWYK